MSNPTELPVPNIYEQVAILGTESQCRDLLLEIARRAKPEGEAPQADDTTSLRSALMAVDGQLCAILNGADGSLYSKLKAARNDLVRIWLPMGGPAAQQAAPTPRIIGGQRWSKEAEMTEGWLSAQQAAAPDAMTAFRKWHQEVGDQDCEYTWLQAWTAAQLSKPASAPGTPEAPAELPRLYRFDCYVGKTKMAAGVGVHATSMEEAEQKARKMIDKNETIKFESNRSCHPTRKCGICSEYERAAQLDGGQGEGGENG